MNKIAARVAQDLDLDVARALDIFLRQQRAVAESLLSLAPRGLDGAINRAFSSHDAHALAAAARRGLDQNRKADFDHPRAQRFGALILAVVTWDDRRAGLSRQPARRVFQPHRPNRGGRRADEDDSRGRAAYGKLGVLGQKPVAGMNRFGAGSPGRLDDLLDSQIRLSRRGRAQMNGLAGESDMWRVGVGVGID